MLRRHVRVLPGAQVQHHEAFRARRRRGRRAGAQVRHRPGVGAGGAQLHHRDAPPGPYERSRERDEEADGPDIQRVPGDALRRRGAHEGRGGLGQRGRRQVPSRDQRGARLSRRTQGPSQPRRQPLSSRVRQPRGPREDQGEAGLLRRQPGGRAERRPDSAPRRRRVRRPGRGLRDDADGGRRGLQRRGDHPRDRQQPDRLHHEPHQQPLHALRVGPRQGLQRADLSRQRRRRRRRLACARVRGRVETRVGYRRRHRHDLLQEAWAQRARSAELHPAHPVQGDTEAQVHARHLRAEVDRRGDDDQGRGEGGPRVRPRQLREGIRGQ
mmetsp:Transcript_25880/g.58036  ORF Transcript_25880/g.58036 Transcript_25880/m.58036 type:complete len:326 (+) Transcript_25880:894-1871(+)